MIKDLQPVEASSGEPSSRALSRGFNQDVAHKGRRYHVQTEDLGERAACVETQVFVGGGRLLKRYRSSYAGIPSALRAAAIRRLMTEQHDHFQRDLLGGLFDESVPGAAPPRDGDAREGPPTLPSTSTVRIPEPDHHVPARIDTLEATFAIEQALERLRTLDGYVGACVVDGDGDGAMTLGIDGGSPDFDIERAAAANADIVRAERRALRAIDSKDEIEDILITLGGQYHLIRPMRARAGVFVYAVLDRSRANLALARMALASAERALAF